MKRDPSTRPARLAQCAFEQFAEQGFENVNLDRIAAQAGVTKGSLYWHYRSKHELILAACQFYYRRWHQAVQREIAPFVKPEARLRRALEYSVHSCVIDRKNRLFTTGIFLLMQQDPDVRTGWSQFYDSVREVYVGLVAAVRGGGEDDEPETRRAVDLMLEAMEGIKLRAAFEPQIAEPAEQQDLVAGLWSILEAREPVGAERR